MWDSTWVGLRCSWPLGHLVTGGHVILFLLCAGKLHVQGVPEECRSLLERLGGVRGIATKLSTNVETGINADDIIERVEAYVVVAHSVSSCWG